MWSNDKREDLKKNRKFLTFLTFSRQSLPNDSCGKNLWNNGLAMLQKFGWSYMPD